MKIQYFLQLSRLEAKSMKPLDKTALKTMKKCDIKDFLQLFNYFLSLPLVLPPPFMHLVDFPHHFLYKQRIETETNVVTSLLIDYFEHKKKKKFNCIISFVIEFML
jgi:hypothetical protein